MSAENTCSCPGKAALGLLQVLSEQSPNMVSDLLTSLGKGSFYASLLKRVSREQIEELEEFLKQLNRTKGRLGTPGC